MAHFILLTYVVVPVIILTNPFLVKPFSAGEIGHHLAEAMDLVKFSDFFIKCCVYG